MIDFSDLEDDAKFNAASKAKPVAFVYEYDCPKCRGSGRFRSHAGRDVGPCNLCAGKGKLSTPLSQHDLQKRKASAAKGRQTRDQNRRHGIVEFQQNNAAEYQWMLQRQERFEFAGKMLNSLNEWGSLTDNQLAAVRRCMQQDEVRKVEFVQERTAKQAEAAKVDLSGITKAFAAATGSGLKRPVLRIGDLTLSLAGAHSANAGMIYARRGETYLGKIANGQLSRSREATSDDLALLLAASANPLEQAVAYGRQTGTCACCGRELTDPESIAAGIGPVCASKWGF